MRPLSHHCSSVMGQRSHQLCCGHGPMGTRCAAASGRRRARPVHRAGLRRHHRRPDRRPGRADQEHLLPALPGQAGGARGRAGHAVPAPDRGHRRRPRVRHPARGGRPRPRGRRHGVHAGTARARAQAPGRHRRQRRAARTRRAQARRPGQGDRRRPQGPRRARPDRQPRGRARRPRAAARLRPLDRPGQRPAAGRARPPVPAGAAGGQRRPPLTVSPRCAGRATPARAGTGSRCRRGSRRTARS